MLVKGKQSNYLNTRGELNDSATKINFRIGVSHARRGLFESAGRRDKNERIEKTTTLLLVDFVHQSYENGNVHSADEQ